MPIYDRTGQQGQVVQPQVTRGGGVGPFGGNSSAIAGPGTTPGVTDLVVDSEGRVLSTNTRSINFVGEGVTVSAAANDITVSVGGLLYMAGEGININGRVISIADGGVTTVKIADMAVTADKLANNAVTTVKVSDRAITSNKIALNGVTTQNIADGAVTSVKIADGAIGTTKLADGSVTTVKIVDGAITNPKLANDAVATDNIQDAAVTNPKLADNSVSITKIVDDSISTAKMQDTSVTTAKIANDAVDSEKLADNAVYTNKIVDRNVTNAKLQHDDITINGERVELGGAITIDVNPHPIPDQSSLRLSLSPSSVLQESAGSTEVVATLSTTTGFTVVAGSTSIDVTDVNNNPVADSESSDTRFLFDVSRVTPGLYSIVATGTVNRTSDDSDFRHRTEGTVRVARGWYTDLDTSQPSALSQMSNLGVWSGSGTRREVANNTARMWYMALPTRTGGYDFKSGQFFLNTTNLGTIGTFYTLYRIDDWDDSQSGSDLTVTVTEA